MFSSNTTQESAGYQISRSLRFNSADSAYLNRTPASAGNRKTWTWSGWVKRSSLDSFNMLFATSNGQIYFDNQKINVTLTPSAGIFITTAVYRDVSAWYHIVVACDTTQATAANRLKLYVNGVQVTDFGTSTAIAQNADTSFNDAVEHNLGRFPSNYYLNGYMTEVNFIDGQALTPSSFGITNPDTGVWQPKAYSGTYGTNGFYLNFSDNSNTTAATLGKDYSGNGNNWTPNNFSVSAGAGNDSLVDVPTNWGTDTGVGGTVRGNYATLNPLDKSTNASAVNGNLDATSTGSAWLGIRATLGMQTGKWYCEYTPTSGTFHIVSVSQPQASTASYIIDSPLAYGYQWDGQKVTNNAASSYGSGWGVGDIIGIAFDADAGTITFYKNNVSQGVAFSGLTSGPYIVGLGIYPTATGTFNFGQRPFAYTAPSGFKALNTQNLPTPTVGATTATQAGKFFNPVLYTGNGGTLSVSGVGFQPDFTWLKGRNYAWNHGLFDVIRGPLQDLISNSTGAEVTVANSLTAWNSSGFSLGPEGTFNNNNDTYVAWNWKANGAGVTNTAGSITSTVSANTTSGFSVVTYTGNGTEPSTVGHGLGVAPKMIIVKNRSVADDWWVWRSDLATLNANNTLRLNLTNAVTASLGVFGSVTSSVFTTKWPGSGGINTSGSNFVAYCFAEVQGFSKAFSYTGNGSADGAFVFTGMRPAYVLLKRTDTTSNWTVLDFKRLGYNVDNNPLYPNLSDAEGTTDLADLLSNGFKLRSTDASVNASGGTYIGFAFAESPFKYALAR